MTEKAEFDLDRALGMLADDVRAASPRPGDDLVARVLADASTVGAGKGQAVRIETQPASRPGLGALLFGWTGGAVAAFALCLMLGVGVGMELDAQDLPLLGDGDDVIAMAAEAGPFADEIL